MSDNQMVRVLDVTERSIYERYTGISADGARAVFLMGSRRFYLQAAEKSPEEVEDFRRALACALLAFYEEWRSLEDFGKLPEDG